jgi:hypothetical protein
VDDSKIELPIEEVSELSDTEQYSNGSKNKSVGDTLDEESDEGVAVAHEEGDEGESQ